MRGPHGILGYERDFPILRERGIPFAFDVYPAAVNRAHAIRCVSWEDLRVMARHGATIGGCSMSHPIRTKPPKSVTDKEAYDAWLEREIVESKAKIEGRLEAPGTEFAVPFGAFDRYVCGNIKAAGYALAPNAHGAIADSRADPLSLNRVIVLGSMSTRHLVELASRSSLRFRETRTIYAIFDKITAENLTLYKQ